MSNERERALEAALKEARSPTGELLRIGMRQMAAVPRDVPPGASAVLMVWQPMLDYFARALLASSPPPSCEMRKALEKLDAMMEAAAPKDAWDVLCKMGDVVSAALDASQQEQKMKFSEAQIKHMVGRFLSWKLPENFRPDGGISFKATFNEHTAHPMKHEPFGTNLFDATQADAMVRYMLADMPLASRTEEKS